MPPLTLGKVLDTARPVRIAVFENLSASDVATLCFTLPVKLSPAEKKKYLAITRDLGSAGAWIEKETKKGKKVVLVGTDLEIMRDRIMHPSFYWARKSVYWIGKPYRQDAATSIDNGVAGRKSRHPVKLWVIVTASKAEMEYFTEREKAVEAKITAVANKVLNPELYEWPVRFDIEIDREPDKLLWEENDLWAGVGVKKSEITNESRMQALKVIRVLYLSAMSMHFLPEPLLPEAFIEQHDKHYPSNSNLHAHPQHRVNADWREQIILSAETGTLTSLVYYQPNKDPNKPAKWIPDNVFRTYPDKMMTWTLMLGHGPVQPSDFKLRASLKTMNDADLAPEQLEDRETVSIRVKVSNGEYAMMKI